MATTSHQLAAVILAAGKSTRMKSALPKAAHPVCGKPMTCHVIDSCRSAGARQIVVVVGHEAETVKGALGDDVIYALQAEQLGTGHATGVGLDALPESTEIVLVLAGDTPLIRPESLTRLVETHVSEGNSATLLTAVLPDAGSYGRIVRGPDDNVVKIVEAKDASPEILAIREINPSFYVFDMNVLREKLRLIRPANVQGEYYLTDVIGLMVGEGQKVGAIVSSNAEEVLGINTHVELSEAARLMRTRIADNLMLSGVTLADPSTAYIDVDVEIGQDTVIMPCTIIERGCRIGKGCRVGPFAHLIECHLGDDVTVDSTRLQRTRLENGATVSGRQNRL